MKHIINRLMIAVSIGLSSSALASELAPSFALSQHKLDENYDFMEDCGRDCHYVERKISVEFWHNIITGRDNANEHLELTKTTKEIARFLTQTTFGATARDINQLQQSVETLTQEKINHAQANQQGVLSDSEKEDIRQAALYEAQQIWITQQINLPRTRFLTKVHNYTDHLQGSAWWHQSLTAPDQLRQRVAFALNHIQTISSEGALTKDATLAEYYDLLIEHGLGDFRQLLHAITYSIGMGTYLDNLSNITRDGKQPNENYARELLQLFSLGTELLNSDGSSKLDSNGKPIPTYSEADVVSFARALSGFRRGGKWLGPAALADGKHFQGEKRLFAGTVHEKILPASNTAAEDVEQALDAIFNHPNVAPFMAKRLIQHLVTSNPSPQYIERVAKVFEADSEGQRGNMAAVVTATLLDDEARNPIGVAEPNFYGKLKEPVLRITNLIRAFEVDPGLLHNQISAIQKPLYAPSVFSFFQPDDTHTGVIADSEKVAPEFMLVNDTNQAILRNALHRLIFEIGYPNGQQKKKEYTKIYLIPPNKELSTAENTRAIDTYEGNLALTNPDALLDRYNLLLMGGSMDETMKQKIVDFIQDIPVDESTDESTRQQVALERARKALYLVMTSNQQAIQQ